MVIFATAVEGFMKCECLQSSALAERFFIHFYWDSLGKLLEKLRSITVQINSQEQGKPYQCRRSS